jgi:ribonuclease R
MADDYYRFVERAHTLQGENTGRVYRLGDRVTVQVIKVDMERRQIDLGLSEILDRVRESEKNRGPRRSRIDPGHKPHGARTGLPRRSDSVAKAGRSDVVAKVGRRDLVAKAGRSDVVAKAGTTAKKAVAKGTNRRAQRPGRKERSAKRGKQR